MPTDGLTALADVLSIAASVVAMRVALEKKI
jgi:hypothetical protein